jgi:hypothetical protein
LHVQRRGAARGRKWRESVRGKRRQSARWREKRVKKEKKFCGEHVQEGGRRYEE